MSKQPKPTIASLTSRVAELEAYIEQLEGRPQTIESNAAGNNTRYVVPGIRAKGLVHTPSAVDAIRLFTWAAKAEGMEKKGIIAHLINQGYTKTTVRARVARIFDGTDESCYSEEIRARLGLDLDEEDEVEGDEE